jgi:hypothetical protein
MLSLELFRLASGAETKIHLGKILILFYFFLVYLSLILILIKILLAFTRELVIILTGLKILLNCGDDFFQFYWQREVS